MHFLAPLTISTIFRCNFNGFHNTAHIQSYGLVHFGFSFFVTLLHKITEIRNKLREMEFTSSLFANCYDLLVYCSRLVVRAMYKHPLNFDRNVHCYVESAIFYFFSLCSLGCCCLTSEIKPSKTAATG